MQDKHDLTQELVRELLREKRSQRRWKDFRFLITTLLIVLVLMILFSSNRGETDLLGSKTEAYVSFIRLDGTIAPGKEFSAETVLPLLRKAFSDKSAKGVVIDINSGGGTPVQASIIHDAIVRLKQKYHKKVVVVGEDILASGAYYVAVSADKIYVNPNTITGSIGVIMRGFGFPELIRKLGVERRVYTAGANKDRLDAFLPQKPEDIEKIRQVIDEVHQNFNQIVLQDRRGKLHASPKELFSGDFWSGQSALRLGLVDALGNLTEAMTNEFHVTRFKDYSGSLSLLKSMVNQAGMSMGFMLEDDRLKLLEKF